MNYHRLYLDSVFALAETLVIKSEYSAERINDVLRARYGTASVDNLAPETWKYHLNLCGVYHSTDEVMEVLSLDTLQIIAFTKQNLLSHIATANAYQFGSRYYQELLQKYPTQEFLIKGILYQANMTDLLASPDMQVVAYPKALVEDNEDNLIRDINLWLANFTHRWHIPAFNLSDDLYGLSLLGVMYGQLVPLIITTRLRNCKTPRAHSYHVRQYLASHGMLDEYLRHMTTAQALFFYRNAAYLERHSGKASTFAWLTDQVLTKRGLPLAQYRMRHDTSSMPGTLTPEVTFVASGLNPLANTNNTKYSTAAILSKEASLAFGNPARISATASLVEEALKYSRHGVLDTKLLESSTVDNSASSSYNMQDVALALWGYSAATNRYNVYVRIKNPQTGAELTLSTLQAYYYFLFAYCQVHTLPLQTIPKIYAQRIPRWPAPSLESVMNHIDTQYVSQATVEALMTQSMPAGVFINTDMFKTAASQLFDTITLQARMVAREEHFYSQALLLGAFHSLYGDHFLTTPETGEEIKPYLFALNLPVAGFTAEEWQGIYLDIFQVVTGTSMKSEVQTSDMQKAMVRLMGQLSSYSVQFISEISGASIKSMNWSAIRLGDSSGASRSYFELLCSIVEVFDGRIKPTLRLNVPVLPISNALSISLSSQPLGELMLPVHMSVERLSTQAKIEVVLDLGQVEWDNRFDPNAPEASSNNGIFSALTQTQINEIESIHHPRLKAPLTYPQTVDLTSVVHHAQLNSFSAVARTHVGMPAWEAFWGPQQVRYFSDDTTIVVLNGIWPFGGTQSVTAFAPVLGRALTNSFKYISGADKVIENDIFRLTNGNLSSVTFAQGPAEGDVDIGSLHVRPIETTISFAPVTHFTTGVSFVNRTSVVKDVHLTSCTHNYQISLSLKIENYTLPVLQPVTRLTYLDFNQMPKEVDLVKLKNQTISLTGPHLAARYGVWSISRFNQLFMAHGPSFYGYGVYTLDATTYSLARSSAFNTTLNLQLASRTASHDFTLAMAPPQVHDIPNFAALFALV